MVGIVARVIDGVWPAKNVRCLVARVDARYVFRNDGAAPVVATLAFPMPVFRWDPEQTDDFRNLGPVESLGVAADGRPVSFP